MDCIWQVLRMNIVSRNELLETNQATIRGLSQLVQSVVSSDVICAIGNEKKIQQEAEHFKEIRSVF